MRNLPAVRAAVALVFVALLAGAAACSHASDDAGHSPAGYSATGAHTPRPNSASNPGCVAAMSAVGEYGPTVLKNAVEVRETLDKVEIDVLVEALDLAAAVAGDPAAKRSISELANAYRSFKDSWTGAVVPPLNDVLTDTSLLDSVCGS
jgi:hypothetical protein